MFGHKKYIQILAFSNIFPYANKERKNQKLLLMDRVTLHYYEEI